jgi:hypothetical protein
MYNNVLRKTSPPPSHPIRQRHCQSMYDALKDKHPHLGKRLTQIPTMDFLELTRPIQVPIYYNATMSSNYPSAFDLMEKNQLEKMELSQQKEEEPSQEQTQEPSQEQSQEQTQSMPNLIIEEKETQTETKISSIMQPSDEIKVIITKRLAYIISEPNDSVIFKRKELIGYQISKSNLHIFLKKNTITLSLPNPAMLKKVVNSLDHLLEKNTTCMLSCWFVC